jgi:hypothetical protein
MNNWTFKSVYKMRTLMKIWQFIFQNTVITRQIFMCFAICVLLEKSFNLELKSGLHLQYHNGMNNKKNICLYIARF